MSLRRLEGALCAPHDVPGEVVKVCEADPADDNNGNMLCALATPRRTSFTDAAHAVYLYDDVVALLKRSGAPMGGFPYLVNDAAEADAGELFDELRSMFKVYRLGVPDDAHMSVLLVAILYLRRARRIPDLYKYAGSMRWVAKGVLVGALILANTVCTRFSTLQTQLTARQWVNETPLRDSAWTSTISDPDTTVAAVKRDFLKLIDYRCYVDPEEFAALCRDALPDLGYPLDEEEHGLGDHQEVSPETTKCAKGHDDDSPDMFTVSLLPATDYPGTPTLVSPSFGPFSPESDGPRTPDSARFSPDIDVASVTHLTSPTFADGTLSQTSPGHDTNFNMSQTPRSPPRPRST
jgi:hypothetical protein